ncbi:tellurite resistance TerB family protein [Salinicola sp. DM10]|uniref:tellurite resistance TerB family protein n=1 Tax=Salinicola sp. DM10 TaxID=2815721 RepID=UPI001A8CDA97|nr:tellurite resistance TerB family protein [Salinicola sp. DM10]MCE3028700.1 tellurite resistance TerB family protein [Salinicola sp. DM10]
MNAQRILSQLMQQAGGGQRQKAGSGGFDVKSLLGGGALGMLIGSKRGRSLGGKAIKYGALAGLGALAWKAWQSHQAQQSAPAEATSATDQPLEQLSGERQETRSRGILKAMIAAARADGHIDAAERAALAEQIDALGADDELHAWVEREMSAPLDAEAIARDADSPQAAREIYLASVAIIDDQNPMEKAWLDQLAQALSLDGEMRQALEREVHAG